MFAGILACILLHLAKSSDVLCRDHNGRTVDWWLMYKLPDMNSHPSQLVKWGVGYLYLDALNPTWELGRVSLNRTNHALARTLQQYYDKKDREDSLYLMYNDDHPSDKKDSYRGHSKGVLFFDQNKGFWLVHSIPRFPSPNTYSFPQSGSVFGQSLLCVSFYTQQALETIADVMMFTQPSLYASHLPEWAKDDFPVIEQVIKKKSKRKGPFSTSVDVTSAFGTRFKIFAKHRKWGKDLYADLVGPGLESSLFVETWLNGPGDLPSQCKTQYHVQNLLSVKPDGILFNTTKDHSKIAFSQKEEEGWVCVGDINRQSRMLSRWSAGLGHWFSRSGQILCH